MKKWIVVVSMLCALVMASGSQAAQVTIDLDKVNPDQAAVILKESQRIAQESQNTTENQVQGLVEKASSLDPENLNKWVDVGGNAFNKFCSIINVQANDLLKSPAGVAIVGLIAMKMGAVDTVIRVVMIPVAIFVWLVVTAILVYFVKKKTVGDITTKKFDKEGKVTEITEIDAPFHESERGVILFFGAVCLCIITVAMAVTIL